MLRFGPGLGATRCLLAATFVLAGAGALATAGWAGTQPEVRPTNARIGLGADKTIQCAGVDPITAQFVNSSTTVATDAKATVGIPAGWTYPGKDPLPVSAGKLNPGETSEVKHWSLRPPGEPTGPETATLTGIADDSFSYPVQIALPGCRLLRVKLEKPKLRIAGTRLVATGDFVEIKDPGVVFMVGVQSGRAEVTLKRPGLPTKVKNVFVKRRENNSFTAKVPACRPGTYSASVSYLDPSPGYAASGSVGIGKLRADGSAC